MTQLQQTERPIRPGDIRAGDVIRYQLRSWLGPAVLRYSDPIRVARVLDGGAGAVVICADQPITVQRRRSVLLPPTAAVLVEQETGR